MKVKKIAKEKRQNNEKSESGEKKEASQEQKQITLTGNQIAEMLNAENQKFNALSQRNAELQNAMIETKAGIGALKEISKQKTAAAMVPLGAGVFIEASIENKGIVNATMPGNVIIPQGIEKTVKDLEKRSEELRKELERTQQEQQLTAQNMNNLNSIIKAGQAQARRKA